MITRRALLRNSALTGAALTIGGGLSAVLPAATASAVPVGGYGPLVPDPAGLLDLPAGFSYKVLARSQEWTDLGGAPTTYTGTTVPISDAPDGTGSFRGRHGGTLLVRNSELSGAPFTGGVPHEWGDVAVPTYDPAQAGGTSTLEVDADGNLLSIRPSLAGTVSNCAGGITPWGTWLTCEETETVTGTHQHGYVFEVDPHGKKTKAEPIREMGRFAHEAVCIDPRTGDAYLTEDASDPLGLLYRYVPRHPHGNYGSLHKGGTLCAMQALRADGSVVQNLAEAAVVGTTYAVRWLPVPIPDPSGTLTAAAGPSQRLRNQFDDAEITRSKKFEGVWYGKDVRGRDKVWINCSYAKTAADIIHGGVAHEGQVWVYDPAACTIELVVRIEPGGIFDGPDNIVATPFGVAFLCEDGDGDQYVIGVDPTQTLFPFAKNRIELDGAFNEFTGACFDADYRWLFVNTQRPGITYAITGPWLRGHTA